MIGTLSLKDIATATGGRVIGSDCQISSVTTDSSKAGQNSVFVALKGERFDAHMFVPDVARTGASAAVVTRQLPVDIAQIIVPDTLKALGAIAKLVRNRFEYPVIAVTGSSGKTSVKEMLAAMLRSHLGKDEAVLATQGNFNNEIGAPLTLLRLDKAHRYAVVELGASAVGEIAYTTELTQPSVAILNNAMPAHVEGFGSLENIVRAKSEIYQGLSDGGVGIVNLDDPHAQFWIKRLQELDHRTITFGVSKEADLHGENLSLGSDGCYRFNLSYKDERLGVALSVMGRHMVLNALAAAAAWVALGLPLSAAKAGLEKYAGFKGRLQTHRLNSGMLLIDDSYNANPASMAAAIEVLVSLPGPHALAIGDMAELGESEREDHKKLGDLIAAAGISRLYTCGKLSKITSDQARASGIHTTHFASVGELIAALKLHPIEQKVLLAKGSRSAGMDHLVDALLEVDG